jgi:uncharacterized protein YndB with AHSA1/START domain
MVITTTSSRDVRLTLPSDTEIVVSRDLPAPRGLVFDAWSKPEYVRRWYSCADWTMSRCEIDFREGGRWRWALRNPVDGVEHVCSGEYREIQRPERLVFSERYEAIPGSDYVVTLTLTEREPRLTTLTLHFQHQSRQARDAHLQSGAEEGMTVMLGRLDTLLASLPIEV